MKKPRRIFISATGQNDGKTVVSLGLICVLKERFKEIGFIKPVGQRYIILKQGKKIDEDALLIEKACRIKSQLQDMSPIAIEKGFTQKYILRGKKKELVDKIKNSFRAVSKGKDLVVIEGTGHAGVGSVFDLSNATVAKMLNSKVVIVSSGGIGRPIDEIVLNRVLFEKEKVKVIGVIINKVRPEKYKKINNLVRRRLKQLEMRVFGVIPYRKLLSEPTLRQVWEELAFELISDEGGLEKRVSKVLVGAMNPHDALKYFSEGSLLITPGDREDLILTAVGFQMGRPKESSGISGIVLSGGMKPYRRIRELVKKANIPLFISPADTYTTASIIHDLIIKIRPQDVEKIETIRKLVEEYVDVDRLLKEL